jgi:hypothetical protein
MSYGRYSILGLIHTAAADGEIAGRVVDTPAENIHPGDYLPPQPCLDPTPWQDSGFRVGPRPQDVNQHLARRLNRVLLFGPLGVLDHLNTHTVVTVLRAEPENLPGQELPPTPVTPS